MGDVAVLLGKRGKLPLEIRNAILGRSVKLTSQYSPSLEERDLHETFPQFCYIPRLFLSEKANEVLVSCLGSEQQLQSRYLRLINFQPILCRLSAH